jgi:hypothetical protein
MATVKRAVNWSFMRAYLGFGRIANVSRLLVRGLSKIERLEQNKNGFPANLLTVGAALVFITVGATLGSGATVRSWYFTATEIEAAYRYQEQFGRRLHRPINPTVCYFGQKEFPASYQGKAFQAPCSFITETIRHLKAMLEDGAARYLFPLDADHAHLAIPTELAQTKYRNLPAGELLTNILQEPQLVALYHTAEHLTIFDPITGIQSQAKDWHAKRNVLGFFDGRPNKILPPNPDGSGHDKLDRYENVGSIHFLAHRLGEIVFSIDGKSVSFDLSFDEDSAALIP